MPDTPTQPQPDATTGVVSDLEPTHVAGAADPDRTRTFHAPSPIPQGTTLRDRGTHADSVTRPGPTSVSTDLAEIPGYEVLGILGRGGMGVVYKARQTALKRVVALKMVLAGPHAAPEHIARFRAEAEAIARLQHPNIVQVYEVGEAGGHPFFSLEYVRGGSLAHSLDGTPVAPQSAAKLLATLARAVEHAHQNGIIHRDLKPSNILLQTAGAAPGLDKDDAAALEDTFTLDAFAAIPKIADFGLAKTVDDPTGPTRSGSILGSPSYMAPEQAEGRVQAIGPPTDVYALGAILYECLTGRPPFRGEAVWDTLDQVRKQEPVPPSRFQPRVPADLETICLKCLRKEPAQRYPRAGELADDLERFLRGEPIRARPAGPVERTLKWTRRHPALAALSVVSAIAALALVGVLVSLSYSTRLETALREARLQRKEAVHQRAIAEQNRKIADDRRVDAESQRALARRYLYFSHMSQAERAWQDAELGRMDELLRRHTDDALHGFEWRFLRRLRDTSLMTLSGHKGEVRNVAVSPDGRRIATCGSDGTVKVWDAETGREQRTYRGHKEFVWCVTFSPDSRHVASGGFDRTIRIWDAGTGEDVATLEGHTGAVVRLTYSRDGSRLASGGWDEGERTVKVWDVAARKPILSLPVNVFTGVALSPDGTLVAAGDRSGVVSVWDLTGKVVHSLKGHAWNPTSLAFHPDGTRLVSASLDRTVRVWDLAKEAPVFVHENPRGIFLGVEYSPDGKWIAAACGDTTVWIWDSTTGDLQNRLKGHTAQVFAARFTPDGNRIVTCSFDQTAKVWSTWAHAEGPVIWVRDGIDGSLAFSPDGRSLASAGKDSVIRLWDPATGRERRALRGHTQGVRRVAFRPDGRQLASGSWDITVRLWDLAGNTEPRVLTGHSSDITGIAYSPDGQRLATCSGDKTVRLWDVASGKPLRTLEGHTHWVYGVAFGPKGDVLASCGADGTARLWDLSGGQAPKVLAGHQGHVTDVAFSPDGQRLATSGADRSVRMWDVASGRELLVYKGHNGPVTRIAFSPDGHRIASAGGDWSVKVWDPETGAEGLSLAGHANNVIGLAFSPDGRRLASGDENDSVRVWDATPQDVNR